MCKIVEYVSLGVRPTSFFCWKEMRKNLQVELMIIIDILEAFLITNLNLATNQSKKIPGK